jgi:hypothetical protein
MFEGHKKSRLEEVRGEEALHNSIWSGFFVSEVMVKRQKGSRSHSRLRFEVPLVVYPEFAGECSLASILSPCSPQRSKLGG